MIETVSFYSGTELLKTVEGGDLRIGSFSLSEEFVLSDMKPNSYFEITFSCKIISVRTSSYEWSSDFKFYTAGPLAPKLIRLENGSYAQANCSVGFWEIDCKNQNRLIWHLNPDNSRLLAQYAGNDNLKTLVEVPLELKDREIKLLLTDKKALEWSRSKIPFSAIACFTDHCDFDTPENLQLQRELFREAGIRTTKGIFLHHFSKREDNASWELDAKELDKWIEDGHELAYHSLSQSLKTKTEAFSDFEHFKAPKSDMPTWIDHGFQPYNLSLIQKQNVKEEAFFAKMESQGILNFWNYVDSGTATKGVLNQLNAQHFTLKTFFRGIKGNALKDRPALFIKNVFFHFYANEKLIDDYKLLAAQVKKVVLKGKLNQIPKLGVVFLGVSKPLLKVGMQWGKVKNKIYPLAKFNPVLFNFKVNGKAVTVFQTLEMLDFKNTLAVEQLERFHEDKGVFIAHTYFSVPMEYHKGRMFLDQETICPVVTMNFMHLGELIKQNKIWNPTFSELANHFVKTEKLQITVDEHGHLALNNIEGIHFRYIE